MVSLSFQAVIIATTLKAGGSGDRLKGNHSGTVTFDQLNHLADPVIFSVLVYTFSLATNLKNHVVV
ncbi:hypothetical protein Enr10x_32510 [Gimesia panareensis]|uniref:Uncharacterized protein n=1 Tax=Gimesia panareensis TaxID=2527978 RepID=A0A517Q8I8_9PLAN|nr:hypothetical protein Enr10x_32510 [Gimesia panareensis]